MMAEQVRVEQIGGQGSVGAERQYYARDVTTKGVTVRLVIGFPVTIPGVEGAEFFTEGPSARSGVVRVREVQTGMEIAWGRYRDDAVRAAVRVLKAHSTAELKESIASMVAQYGPLPEVGRE